MRLVIHLSDDQVPDVPAAVDAAMGALRNIGLNPYRAGLEVQGPVSPKAREVVDRATDAVRARAKEGGGPGYVHPDELAAELGMKASDVISSILGAVDDGRLRVGALEVYEGGPRDQFATGKISHDDGPSAGGTWTGEADDFTEGES